MKTLVEFVQLPELLSGNEGLERWLEGDHGSFEPQDALINALYARFSNNLKTKDEYPLLDRPFVLDLAFKPVGKFKTSVHFGLLGVKQRDDKNEYDLIKISISDNEFDKIDEIIEREVKSKQKKGFSYPDSNKINISVNYDTTRDIKLIELINETQIVGSDPTANLYATKITVTGEDFYPFQSNRSKLSFKHTDNTYAKSRYSSFNYDKKKKQLETSRIPTYFEHREKPVEFDFNFRYKILSDCDLTVLGKLESAVCKRIDSKIESLRKQKHEKLKTAGDKKKRVEDELEKDIERLTKEKEMLDEGLKILKNDKNMLVAFRLLNKTFLTRSEAFKTRGMKTVNESWRSFQLTFILSQTPLLMDNGRAVTLLNFPTGMGKTEAFLGLTIMKIFYERLQKSNHGTSTIIKYPRKLLSRQQVKRALELVGFANSALFNEPDLDLKNHPISVGTLFNSEDTPNRYTDAGKNHKEVSKSFQEWIDNPYNRAVRVENCPYCNNKVEIKADKSKLRIKFICKNKECIFNKSELSEFFERGDGEIPLYIGDDEVFRYHPSILVTTIDKFSSFSAYNANFKCLLLDPRIIKCDGRYGFYFIEKQFANFKECKSGKDLPLVDMKKYFKCPSLFIFDEIHLLSGSYASKFSIVENAFMEIFDKNGDNPAKVVCSSATLKQTFNGAEFSYQTDFSTIFHVPSEKVILYPVFWDTFVDESDEIARIMKMVMPCNFSRYLAIEHISEYYLKRFNDIPDADKIIQSTPLYYFKSKARLERVRGSIYSRVIEKKFVGKNSLSYPINTKMEFSTDIDQSVMSGYQQDLEKKLESPKVKLDMIFATNTIANGLDVDAFNLMFIFSFPNHISEYIQARSRIARRKTTGLCICVLEQRDVREASIFYDFHDMHKNIDLAIEGNPVNLEARGIVKNTVKKLFHLSMQLNYDTADKPFYLASKMREVLSSEEMTAKIKEQVYGWFDFEKSDVNRKNFYEDIWDPYINEYRRWLEEARPITIYDDDKNRYLPQPSLLDISPFVKVKLQENDAVIANDLSFNVIEIDEQPNEEGDDVESDNDGKRNL